MKFKKFTAVLIIFMMIFSISQAAFAWRIKLPKIKLPSIKLSSFKLPSFRQTAEAAEKFTFWSVGKNIVMPAVIATAVAAKDAWDAKEGKKTNTFIDSWLETFKNKLLEK